jgi:transcriptional regulator with XRE-family HTH domain
MADKNQNTLLLGEKISGLRKSKGISQELLAENSHVSLRTIQRIESGASTPRLYTLKVIADVLGVQVDQLNSTGPRSSDSTHDIDEFSILGQFNLSTLVVFIFPFGNIILPLLLWRKNKHLPLVDVIGRKICSFQVLWTLGTFLVAIPSHMILKSLTRSVSIGRLPPTIFLIYFIFLVINVFFIIRSSIRLGKRKKEIYAFVPSLF